MKRIFKAVAKRVVEIYTLQKINEISETMIERTHHNSPYYDKKRKDVKKNNKKIEKMTREIYSFYLRSKNYPEEWNENIIDAGSNLETWDFDDMEQYKNYIY